MQRPASRALTRSNFSFVTDGRQAVCDGGNLGEIGNFSKNPGTQPAKPRRFSRSCFLSLSPAHHRNSITLPRSDFPQGLIEASLRLRPPSPFFQLPGMRYTKPPRFRVRKASHRPFAARGRGRRTGFLTTLLTRLNATAKGSKSG